MGKPINHGWSPSSGEIPRPTERAFPRPCIRLRTPMFPSDFQSDYDGEKTQNGIVQNNSIAENHRR